MSKESQPTVLPVTEPLVLKEQLADGQVELNIAIPPDLIFFRGHFPNIAILPGVVQVDWVMGFSKRYFNLGGATARTIQIKFRRVIRPGDHLSLTLTCPSGRGQIQFAYADTKGPMSSGRIGLEPL